MVTNEAVKIISLNTELLDEAVQHIVGKNKEKGIKSLFSAGGTTALHEEIKSLNDFEVVSFLVVK